jgi:glutamate synthase domain-containing protein 2
VLAATKNVDQIAKTRGLKQHTAIFSPTSHSAVNNPEGLIKFITQLRKLSNGKPIGFKLCIVETSEDVLICNEMIVQTVSPLS